MTKLHVRITRNIGPKGFHCTPENQEKVDRVLRAFYDYPQGQCHHVFAGVGPEAKSYAAEAMLAKFPQLVKVES